ncbi:MAG TPA: peroxidase family protein [Actinomycetota bacterium]|nr:peroxidase family protein [Actinomycetota bacterium]
MKRAGFLSKAFTDLTEAIDKSIGWSRLPRLFGILTLVGLRIRLRQRNLYDTGGPADQPAGGAGIPPPGTSYLTTRTLDGTYNDLDHPLMGSIGSRFGRNVPIELTYPEPEPAILQPNPRDVSRELLTRDTFIPATTLNLLAGAWLQFEVHDWFSHGKAAPDPPWEVPLRDDDTWPERPMRIPRTRRDPAWSPDSGMPPTYVTADTHWWDASQIYGSDPKFAAAIRAGEDGKIRMDEHGLLPQDLENHVDLTGVAGNFWVGLGLLHTLFSLEHNAICDRLRADYRHWSDDQTFERARLINAALMAKIHTVEWTPAIIAHPTTRLAMNANWWGLVGERITSRFGRVSPNEVISGIPGSATDHHGVPYSLTEEFVAVYRMHPLLPDDYEFRSVATDQVLGQLTFPEIGALHTRDRLMEFGMDSALYSFGVSHPGAITLHNFPRFLQHFDRPDGTIMDLAATDLMRVRERGVPRYNEFRRLFHKKPVASFEELTGGDRERADQIRRVYEGDLDRVDLMIGLYAEPLPAGFGFSDTAFRVFILMASRRLNSDRFFTRDYRPEVYTPAGFDWINRNTMVSVLLRHFPSLEPALRGVQNGFAPWNRVPAIASAAEGPSERPRAKPRRTSERSG